jgi:hypothetical protein
MRTVYWKLELAMELHPYMNQANLNQLPHSSNIIVIHKNEGEVSTSRTCTTNLTPAIPDLTTTHSQHVKEALAIRHIVLNLPIGKVVQNAPPTHAESTIRVVHTVWSTGSAISCALQVNRPRCCSS